MLTSNQQTETLPKGQRTIGELLALGEIEAERICRQMAAEAEARCIQKLEALAPKAEDVWTFAEQLIQQGTGRSYDEAAQLLVNLHNLAIHQGKEAAYEARLRRIRTTYSRRKAILERLDKVGLL